LLRRFPSLGQMPEPRGFARSPRGEPDDARPRQRRSRLARSAEARMTGADRSGPASPPWWRRLRPPRGWRFPRGGRLLVILPVGVASAPTTPGNTLLSLRLGWLLSFIIASGLLSEMTLKRLPVERRPPPRVFAGEPFLMEVVIRNDKP